MEIRVIDFEVLTRNFKPYVDGYLKIEDEKKNFIKSIESEKKEFEEIVKRAQSGLLMDSSSQEKDSNRAKDLQDILMQKDIEYKTMVKTMSDDLNTNVYDQLESIIAEWTKDKEIDLVMGKMEVIFNSERVDVTNNILELIKEKNLFFEKENATI